MKRGKREGAEDAGRPKYVSVHSALERLGEASCEQLRAEMGVERKEILGALATLLRIGAAVHPRRGIWKAVPMPEGYPRSRGRGRGPSAANARAVVEATLAAAPDGVELARLVAAVAGSSAGADDAKRAKLRVAHALVAMRKEGVVTAVGTRGSYKYVLAKPSGEAAA